MKIAKISAPWLTGTLSEVQLSAREANGVARAFEIKRPRAGYQVRMPANWLDFKWLTCHVVSFSGNGARYDKPRFLYTLDR